MAQWAPKSRVYLTLGEASGELDPWMSERELRWLIRAVRWQPAGVRLTGRGGHPRQTYDWGELCDLHDAITPFLKG